MKAKIQVRIHPDGRVVAETKGVKGNKCVDYIKLLEELLEAKTVESAYTEEYYETEQVQIAQKHMNRNKR